MATKQLDTRLEDIHNYGLDVKNRVIYINSEGTDQDGYEIGIEFKVAVNAIKNIDYLNSISTEPILVKLASCGGETCWGFSIYDAIRSSLAPIDILGYSDVASMSSIILQAGKKRIITKNTNLMIHLGDYGASGDVTKVTSGLDFYKKGHAAMYALYAERCVNGQFFKKKKMNKDAVAAYIEEQLKEKGDWWINSIDALSHGFCDEIRE